EQRRARLGRHRDVRRAVRRRRARTNRGEHSDRSHRLGPRHRRPDRLSLLRPCSAHHGRNRERKRRQRSLRMIVLVFTGGTISMRHEPTAGGAVPTLSGHEIIALAPGIDQLAQLDVDDWGAFPGPHMTPDRMWALRARIIDHLARPDVDGVVVTHGTDSLEETAYLVARSVKSDKPIVFTGAMRTSSDLGWDGPGNLGAAI